MIQNTGAALPSQRRSHTDKTRGSIALSLRRLSQQSDDRRIAPKAKDLRQRPGCAEILCFTALSYTVTATASWVACSKV